MNHIREKNYNIFVCSENVDINAIKLKPVKKCFSASFTKATSIYFKSVYLTKILSF